MFEMQSLQSPRKMAVVATLAALGFYLCLLPKTITGDDAGELTVAAYFLGIPHPPGYPTWCLAAHPFTWLPVGSVAWRVALSSAVFSALTCGLTAWLVGRLTQAAWAGLIAALAYAFAVPTVEQSTVAEVYALSHLFTVACLCLLYRWTTERHDGLLWAVALLCGLGQGVHNTMAVLTPIFALYVLATAPGVLRRPRLCAVALGLFLLGLSTFLYLPLRSLANPPIDWGNPETWDNFWAVVGRDQYAFMYSQYPRSLMGYLGQIASICAYIMTSWLFMVYFPLLGLLGLVLALLQHRRIYLLLMSAALVPLLLITWVQNPQLAFSEWEMVMRQFLMPAEWIVAIGFGIVLGQDHFRKRPNFRLFFAQLCVYTLAMNWLIIWFLSTPPLNREVDLVSDYARNLLEQLEPDAILVAGADHLAFPAIYLQHVEGLRPDVALANPYGYLDVALIADAPKEILERLGTTPRRAHDAEYLAWLLQHTTRPVYLSDRSALPKDVPVTLRQEGLLYRAIPIEGGEAIDAAPRWPDSYKWRFEIKYPFNYYISTNYSNRSIQVEFHTKLAAYLFTTGDLGTAEFHASLAESLLLKDTAQINNLAAVYARLGNYEKAADLFNSALQLEPNNEALLRNLARALDKLYRARAMYVLD